MKDTIDILIEAAKKKAREKYPYAPSFKARPFPGSCGNRFWALRALFLEHIKIYNKNGWR